VALLILDGGYRITEVLSLRTGDVDLDGLVVKVMGKGRKVRQVPLSLEMRRSLYPVTVAIFPARSLAVAVRV
jgi:site-specific recombinase XerC